MKTLLFLLDRYPAFGGIETVTTVLANAFSSRFRVVICARRGEPGHALLNRLVSGVTYRLLPPGDKQKQMAALDSILNEEGVSIVIFQDSYAPNEYLAYHIKQKGDIKLIVAEHNAPGHSGRWRHSPSGLPWWDVYHQCKRAFFCTKSHLRHVLRRRRLYQVCDSYVVLSEHFKQEFRENSFVRETSKLCAIGNPVSYAPNPEELKDKKKQVIFIGQFVKIKGIDRLLRIWEKVAPKAPEWELLLVGDGPCMPDVKAQIRERNIPGVFPVGYRTDVATLCAESSVLCLCSDFEGFPMVLPEAMSSGAIPICFHSFASLVDIYCNGVEGFSIPAFHEDAYAEQLLKLMEDDRLRCAMSQAAIRKARDFSIAVITQHWLRLFERL